MGRQKLKCQILGTQITQCIQNVFLSVSLEQKFLVEVQRRQFSAVQHQSTKITKRNNTTMKKESEEEFHARLPAQVPASSVAKISRWQRKTGARRAQCQAKKTGMIEPCAQERIRKNSVVLHTMWRQKAMVLHRTFGKTT